MRFVDEFRDPDAVRTLAERIRQIADGASPMRFMEVCGGHTMAIHRFGISHLLPDNIELLSGPGCPVCVTPSTYVDRAIELAEGADERPLTLTTFGDLYRVPGGAGSLEDAAGRGLDARVVYSPRDALKTAAENRDHDVVFLAVGFETTVPTVAATVMEARAEGLGNFRVLSGHKTMPQALRALMEAPQVALDGFLLPGHVLTITGPEPYRFLPRQFGTACCVTGFEPTDILQSVLALARQVLEQRPSVENRYRRVVRTEGNPTAKRVVETVFEPVDSQWRGLGMIAGSGLDVRREWQDHAVTPPDPAVPSVEHDKCLCTEVLRGIARPTDCSLFGTVCVPDSPIGPCMVSSEGACAAFYKYGT